MENDLFGDAVKEPETMDLVVKEFNLGTLTTNAQVILATVREKLKGYSADRYTEENIDEAKKDKAELNAAAKRLNDKRIELEKEWVKPFDAFKSIIGEATNEIKKASGQIDNVVKEVEDKAKLEKRIAIDTFFDSQACEYLTLDRIFNPAWLNKTYKMKDIGAEILAKIEKTKSDLALLDRLGEQAAKEHYLSTLNLEAAVAEADRIKANRARLEAMEKARLEKEAEKPAEKPEIIDDTIVLKGTISATVIPVESFGPRRENSFMEEKPILAPEPEPQYERTFKVRGTKAQIIALGEYMNANGLVYEKI